MGLRWWPGTESNRRRQPFQSCALQPTRLYSEASGGHGGKNAALNPQPAGCTDVVPMAVFRAQLGNLGLFGICSLQIPQCLGLSVVRIHAGEPNFPLLILLVTYPALCRVPDYAE